VSTRSEPLRIVSLVPSLTEALFALGLGSRVVGVTDYCVHPADGLAGVPRLGGTKNPDCEAIAALAPDLVIANHEENTERAVRRLREAGLDVWVTYPRTVRDGVAVMAELAGLGAPPDLARRELSRLRTALERAEARVEERAGAAPVRCFCPIWRDPWMTVGRETYAHDLLRLCGASNPFADRGDRRYPRVELADVEAAQPEVILLPDEPYAFADADVRELARLDVPAAHHGRIHCVDGTWVTWYGPRIPAALERLGALVRGSG
jgi:ABC-type Fe3+-hydroxamate transport system substrate-binding protein